jgi:hypothetical protein
VHPHAGAPRHEPRCAHSVERLRLVTFTHLGFDGAPRTGQLVVMDAVAEDVLAIFVALRERASPSTARG